MSDPRSPNTISGLVGWYTGLSAEVTSGSVSSWKDISGQGNHVTSITGSPQVSTSKVQGPTPGEHIVAFHYGNFDNHYGDGNRANAALNGRIYADTLSHEVPPEFGSLVSGSTASGQTTYTWFPPSSVSADVLVVAGGGGGGIGSGAEGGGGGGAGGLIYNESSFVTSGSQTIVVGNGGAYGRKGYDSKFGTSTAEGGGRGGLNFEETINEGGDGGSGGGARGAGVARAGGLGTTGQGNGGGIAPHRSGGSGGGGAGGVGGNSPGDVTLGVSASVQNNEGGDGGGGGNYSLFGTIYGENGTFSGGGGGGCFTQSEGIGGTGGSGGGGNGASSSQLNGEAGRSHSGGGGGGGMSRTYHTTIPASGGSGIVLARIRVIEGRGQTQFPFLYGGTTDGLTFPTTVMTTTSNHTLFHVARYYKPSGAPSRGRIFNGATLNWLSGFRSNRSGVAYHGDSPNGGWVTPITDLHGNQWVLSTDQRNMYRSNGTDRTSSGYSNGASDQLTINTRYEYSDWAVAEVIIFNRELTSTEYLSVEAYLTAKYFNYDRVPTTGVLSGSLLNAIYYSGTEGVGGVAGYPISIGRLGQRIGNTYQTVLNISDFRLTFSSGLIRRTYSHSATAHPETETALTNLFNGATRTAGPTVVGNINTPAAAAADYYGMIWIGYIYIATTGTYTFGTNSDDASDMHINYTRVTHAYNGHGVAADGVPHGVEQYTAYLEQGYYRFSYRFEEMGGGDGYQALWKTPGSTSWAVIPSSVFFHDDSDESTATEPFNPLNPLRVIGILDDISLKPGAAYSIRLLFKDYSGPQIRIRRSSDNQEADIYMGPFGVILNIEGTSETNLTTWLDTSTAYVKTWYDQSGNGNHMYSSQEPKLEYDSSKNSYMVNTNGLNTLRPLVSSTYNNLRIGNGAYSAIATFKLNSTSVRKMFLSVGPANTRCGGENIHPLAVNSSGKFGGGACGGLSTWSTNSGTTPTTDSYTNMITTFSGGSSGTENIYIDNVFDKSATMTTNTPTSTDNRIGLGWIKDDGANYTVDAKIFTMLFYPNDELSSGQRSLLNQLLF
jgi:hypothetical protein